VVQCSQRRKLNLRRLTGVEELCLLLSFQEILVLMVLILLFLRIRRRLRFVKAGCVILVLKNAVDSLDEVSCFRDGGRRLCWLMVRASMSTLMEHVELSASHSV